MPSMAFMGVLISCDIFARKLDFALLAFCAASLASFNLFMVSDKEL